MPIYEYQGQQYDIATTDPVAAKQKILAHLGKSQQVPTPSKPKVDLATQKLIDAGEIPVPAYSTKQVVPGERTSVEMAEDFGKQLVAEGLSAVSFVAAAPEFVAGVVAQGVIEPTKQIITKAAKGQAPYIDWGKAREDASKVVSPLGVPSRAIEPLANYLGLGNEYRNSGINRSLETLGDGLNWVATETEKKTGIPKEGTMAFLETLMVTGAPGAKAVAKPLRKAIEPVTTDIAVRTQMVKERLTPPKKETVSQEPTLKDIVTGLAKDTNRQELLKEVDVPAMPTSAGELSDALYTLNDKKKADATNVANIEDVFTELNVPQELKEKFRRFAEDTAAGNERINIEIDLLKQQQKLLHEDNARLYKEGDLKSAFNPEGTTLWKDLPGRADILENRKLIDDLEKQMEDLRSKYSTREELNPWEQRLYNETVGPQIAKITELNKYLQEEGLTATLNMDPAVVGGYAPRLGMPEKKNAWENFKDKVSGDQFGIQQDFNSGIMPPAAKERAIYVHELPNGTRKVITFKGNDIYQWKQGESSRYMGKPVEGDMKAGDKLGLGTIKEATLDEIELNTPYRYSRNFPAVSGTRLVELKDAVRINEFVKQWMESPQFKEVAHKITKGVEAPAGFVRPEHLDRMPQLNDYVFDPRTAEILEDFNRRWEPTFLTEASNAVIKNMMVNPLPHIHNEAVHWYLSRGASGFLNPASMVEFGTTFPKAFLEVYNKGPLYKEIMREGGSIMSANVRNNILMEKAFEKGLNELKEDPGFKAMAKSLGRTPLDLYNGISKQSNKAMWSMRDVLYTQLIMEKMNKGASLKDAIRIVERHMPNYRLPSRVGEKVVGAKLSRVASKVLQNPNFTVFARYKHGMISSFLNGAKDLLMLDKNVKKSTQFKNGVDYMLALGVLMGVVYPVMDSIFQSITDEDSAKVRRAGVTHLFSAIQDISQSKKDSYALLSALITFNPILQAGAQLAFNYELYNRRNIYNIEDDWDIIAEDLGKYGLRLVPQVSEGMRASSEFGGGWKQWMLKNLDVKTQTREQKEREEDQIERRKEAAENRRDER